MQMKLFVRNSGQDGNYLIGSEAVAVSRFSLNSCQGHCHTSTIAAL